MAAHIATKTCAYGRADKLRIRIPGGSAARPNKFLVAFVAIFAPIGLLVVGFFALGIICGILDTLRSHGV